MRPVLFLALLAACEQELPPENGPVGSDTITADELRVHVSELASDAFLGRGTGEEGLETAAAYLVDQLGSYGLEPLPGHDGFRVDYTLYASGWEAENTHLTLRVGGEAIDAVAGTDFQPFAFSDAIDVEGDVVFAGYGITAPEHDWDDYAGLNVRGKVVLLLRHEPDEADENSSFDGKDSTGHAAFIQKARNAAEHGAVGMLVFTDPLHHADEADDLRLARSFRLDPPDGEGEGEGEGEGRQRGQPRGEDLPFVGLRISRELADRLVSGSGHTLAALQEAVDAGTPVRELRVPAVHASMGLEAPAEATPVQVPNVVGYLPGTDRADEWVVYGAHFDHLGGVATDDGDGIYNGADDNASGTASVLELAQAYAAGRRSRSVAFAFFSAEEKGLLGSRAIVRDAVLPADDVVFMINLDMVGRLPDKPVQVIGDGYATDIGDVVTQVAAAEGLDVALNGTSYQGNSDHDSFFREAVPSIHIFTGIHEDYHQLSDHVDKVAFDRMQTIARLAYGVGEPVANGAITPMFVHHIGWLGATVQVVGDHAVVTSVEKGGRGDDAGLKAGAVIALANELPYPTEAELQRSVEAIGDRAVIIAEGAHDVGPAFGDLEPGTRFALPILGDGGVTWIVLERAKTGYLGVFPGGVEDEVRKEYGLADDEGLTLRQVMPDGPAEKSGLKANDILIRIGGRKVGIMSLGQQLQRIGAGEQVEVVVIRDGERQTLDLELGERPERRRP